MGVSALVRTLVFAFSVAAVFGADKLSIKDLENDNVEAAAVNAHVLDKSDTTGWTVDFVRKQGYTIETHQVTTQDGYILTLHRIPSTKGISGKPVLLHHGFLGRSADFVVLGPRHSLAFILADQGYDVWIANARGTTDSKKHTTLSSKFFSYWDFSWHEVGYYDLAAEIDYILEKTGKEKVTYIGFSMGTTAFFVLASMRPEYNDKVDQMFALGPVAFMSNVRGPVLRYITPLLSKARWVGSVFGNAEFLPTTEFVSFAAQKFCADDAASQKLCKNILFLFYGYNDVDLDGDLVDRIFEYSPSGGSVKELLHFGQSVSSGKFRQFDHGWIRNIAKYGQSSPPDYRLSLINIPVHLYLGKNDWFAAPEDVRALSMQLPNTPTVKLLDRETLNHFDFVYLREIKELVYDDILNKLN